MKIVFTGAGGGHFYPLIAVAEKIKEEVNEQKIFDAEMYFFSDKPYNQNLLDKYNIKFTHIPSGKLRLYFSLDNFFDPLKIIAGFFVALFKLFSIYPDLVFTKGGYASLPVVFAAKVLFIPVFLHESDSIPGKTNLITSKFAKRIAISYTLAAKYFDEKKTAYTGQPIISEYLPNINTLDKKHINFINNNAKKEKPTLFILGGSQGSENINNLILESLKELLQKYKIIHQVGDANFEKIKIATNVILTEDPNRSNYTYFGSSDLANYFEEADICVTRAGSTLFEISSWGIPSIIIPITVSNNDHQMQNAYLFQKNGGSIVLEEGNLRKNILLNMIDSILNDKDRYESMRNNNLNNFKAGAADLIAKEIVKIGLSHNY
ncbi:MAG: UDP-N-acetylglucosamine--N-acetylmuramyl-(pentapeptide) pyrophosphoryl-undecaprenol N-acetylglucosamine transferase [Candidatus Pacebacteria bacterium]|nr:UDP-N-acetylglucosamine--N-acetylmuramyl-(pentapeptide) pyrophosphoryl-undecaprenol N-acetylglucosamine transferase [Candidatus Paceibacterota bacterium]